MSVVGYKVRNHPQQVKRRGALWVVDDRATSPDFFATVDVVYGFTLDVAASAANTKCERYFTAEQDGLRQSWADEMVWCNPPYSSIGPWVAKAWRDWEGTRGIVMLLPANRTEQKWWQLLVEPRRDRPGSPLRVQFLPGRLRFIHPAEVTVQPNDRPPFGCCLLIWSKP